MGELHWKTSITRVEPNKLLVRGYPLEELMGKAGFGQMVYLLFKGELPSQNAGKMIEALLTSSVDHGATPPSVLSALTVASTGAPLNAAVAAGILAISKFHGGAIEDCRGTNFTEPGQRDFGRFGLIINHERNKKYVNFTQSNHASFGGQCLRNGVKSVGRGVTPRPHHRPLVYWLT